MRVGWSMVLHTAANSLGVRLVTNWYSCSLEPKLCGPSVSGLNSQTVSQQGVRHFGVVLPSSTEFDELVNRVAASEHAWISKPEKHIDADLDGKLGGKLADPSGNVIEVKYYENASELFA